MAGVHRRKLFTQSRALPIDGGLRANRSRWPHSERGVPEIGMPRKPLRFQHASFHEPRRLKVHYQSTPLVVNSVTVLSGLLLAVRPLQPATTQNTRLVQTHSVNGSLHLPNPLPVCWFCTLAGYDTCCTQFCVQLTCSSYCERRHRELQTAG